MLPSPGALRGARIGLDCANGATSTVAPRLFRALGFDVVVIGAEPDGRNINLECGSTHPERLSALVRHGEAPLRRGVRRRRRSRDPDRRRRAHRRRRRRALSVRQAHAGRRPPQGRRHRRHRDEQHRPRDRAARGRHRHAALPRGRQVRDGGAGPPRPRAGRRAVRPRDLLRAPVHRRRHRDGARRGARHGRFRARAVGARRRAGDVSAGAGQRAGQGEARPRQRAGGQGGHRRASRRGSPAPAGC